MKWLGTLLLLLTITILWIWLPPHLQVRAVRPVLPQASDLQRLLEVEQKPTRVSYLLTSSQVTSQGILGHTSIIIEWSDGKLFMIDAGMDQQAAADFGELIRTMGMAEQPAVYHGSVAQLLGPEVARVSGVGFTHLHIDHTQGLIDFCSARGQGATGFQTQWQRESHNYNTQEGAQIVAGQCLDIQTLPGDKLSLVPGFPGLAAYPLGGHTPGSTLWAVAVDQRILLFSGDITNSKLTLDQDQGKGFLYSFVLVPEDTARTAQLRAWLRSLDAMPMFDVLVSHDSQQIASVLPVFNAR